MATAAGLPLRLGKYELLMPLATGGMARIYVGRTTGIGSFERHVVLKLITPERANDHTAVQMFLDEARLAASLNHQNVAQVFEVGQDEGIHYLAMEYVHGQDLRALLAKAGSQGTRIPLELALTVVAGAAAGLHHAHERRAPDGTPLGIVHRDVSPSNIMIGYDGAVKLLDFGIAKATSRSVETQSGIIKGKFAYMSPEQCRGREVDRRSDVFSLGIILYEITTQHRCFRADSDFDTMHRIVTGDIVRPTRLVHGYPQALEAVVMKALAIDANQRYQSAGFLLEALESYAMSARMSLSTMGLGRFMRETFGDVPEPWLTSAPRQQLPVLPPKEATISSTDGRGSGPIAVQPGEAGAEEDAAASLAGKTILELPRELSRDGDPGASWQEGRRASGPQPAVASIAPAPATAPAAAAPPALAASTYPMPALGRTPTPRGPITLAGHEPPRYAPQGSQPLPVGPHLGPQLVPPGAFATPPSSSGPAMGMPTAYPRYEPPAEPTGGDVKLGTGRRPIYIGIAIGAVAIVILIALLAHGSSSAKPAAAGETAAATDPVGSSGSATATATATAPAPAPVAAPPAPAAVPPPAPATDDFISVHVTSTPPGADVLVAGTKIGTTPLSAKLRRGTHLVPLAVHLAGYADATSKLDLAADFDASLTLRSLDAPPPDAPEAAGSAAGSATPQPQEPAAPRPDVASKPDHQPAEVAPAAHSDHRARHDHARPAPKPRCQPPGAINPFDTSCNGHACPVCK